MSKKAQDKAKQKIIEDKTFGLKNKNRSSKVQAYVQSVQKNVQQSGGQRKPDDNEARRKAREEKKAFEAEMAKLFHDVDGGKKPKGEPKAEGEEDYGCAPDDYLFRPEDFEEVEEDTTRLEEKLETEREALKGRTDLTPVTEESFQAWKAKKRQEAADEEKQRVKKAKAENRLRGYDLWKEDQALFVDDENADEFIEREERGDDSEDEYDLS